MTSKTPQEILLINEERVISVIKGGYVAWRSKDGTTGTFDLGQSVLS